MMMYFSLPISCASDPNLFSKISFTTFIHFSLFLILVFYGMGRFGPALNSSLPLNLTQTGQAWPEDAATAFRFGEEAAVTMAILAFAFSAHTTAPTIFNGIRFTPEEKLDLKKKEEIVSRISAGSTLGVYVYYIFISMGKILLSQHHIRVTQEAFTFLDHLFLRTL